MDTDPEKLCSWLKLRNCNALKYGDELKHFNLAKHYLDQNPEACWEDIVEVLCELTHRTPAERVAREQGVDYLKHCPKVT